ncbi:MAG TPA: LPS-assembly protein LptD, partial [Sutterellaceae bacterium]|nr:LPS-assembly protein LptD [Sutterellaceae bacterium]
MSSFSIRRKRPMEAFRALPVFVAVTLAMPLLVSAAERDQDSETATRPEYGLKLNAARRLDENAPSEEGDAPTYLTAFKMIGTPNEKIELIDSAEVRRGGSVLRGDTITYTFANDEVYSNGNALVARNGTIFKGPELTYHLDAETGEMPNATFRYLPTQMRGTSDKIELLGEGKAKMCNAMVTTCREGEEAWWIKASDIDYDELDGSAVGKNARLYVGGIPVFASPYFSFPVGSERKTGFLTPRFGMSSTLGVNMEVPFYWNIAPNYDYTLTLKPMSKRGVLFGNEFRYLQPTFSGQVDYNVIFKDKETHERRYGVAWKHYQRIGDV